MNRKRVVKSVVLLLVSIVIAHASGLSARASVVGPPIQLATSYIAEAPVVAFNTLHDEFLVVWSNIRASYYGDVWAARVGLDGSVLSTFPIAAAAGEDHRWPAVAYNQSRDEYLVCWTFWPPLSDSDIACAQVDWDGSTISHLGTVIADVDRQERPHLAFNPDHDEYLLVYDNVWTGNNHDVSAQRIAGDGALLSWANIATGPTNDDNRFDVSATYNPVLDEYLLTYSYVDSSSPVQAVVARGKIASYDLLGVSTAPEIDICPVDGAWKIAAAWSPEGYLVTWYATWNLPHVTRGRNISSTGVPLGDVGGFAIGDPPAPVGSPHATPWRPQSIVWSPAVGHVVVFQIDPGTRGVYPEFDIYARVVSPGAHGPLGPQMTIEDASNRQEQPAVDCAPWGTCLVAYVGEDGTEVEVVARILRFDIFADGFDETGDTSRWSVAVP